MTIDPWILAFSAATVIATIWMGFWSARRSKTASDFFVAGRSVSVGWNASAISGEYLSAASFMGVAGMVMSSGYDALWYPVCYACGYLFLLLFIAGPLRRFGAYTIPDFAEGRFDSPVFRKIAVVFVLFIGFFYTMPQMKGAGTTLAYIFPGLPYWAGVVLVGAVITLNVALGGMKGITLVQAFQYWAKMFAISVPIFVLMAVYGHYGKQLGANGGISVSIQTNAFVAITNSASRLSMLNEAKLAIDRYTNQPFFWGGVTNQPLSNHLDAYGKFVGVNVMMSPALEHTTLPQFNFTTKFRPMLGKEFRNLLATNGIEIIAGDSRTQWVVPKSEAVALRAVLDGTSIAPRTTLPSKAPSDSTWLSPFGPLTTKAAKAAEAKLRAESIDESFDEVMSTVTAVNDTRAFALEIAKGEDLLEKHVTEPNLAIGRYLLVASLDDLQKLRKKPVLVSASLLKHFSEWSTNLFPVATPSGTGRIKEIEAGFAASNMGLILANEATLVVPLPRKAEFQKIYDVKGIGPFKNGPVDEKVLKARQKNYSLLYTYSLIIALVCGTAGLPHILVRFYTNPDGVAAKRTTMWVMILIGIFYVFPPVFGVMGRNLLPDLYAGVGAKGTDKIVLELPRILNERYAPLGSILSGITCAGAFAAFMSTFSGLLVSMTGAMAHDVYGRMFRPKSTPEQRLRAFKVCTVIIGGIAIVLGCFVEPLEINFMVGQAFAIAAASYFPLLFMSVWWRGMTMRGAATGMLTGGLCALAAVTLTNVSNLALDKGPMGKVFAGFAPLNQFWAGHPLLRILCEQPAIWTVPLAIGLMIVIGRFTSRTVPPDTRMKMLVLHAPEKLGLKQEYIQEHQHGH